MNILPPELIERVNRANHEQKRLLKVLSTLKTLPQDIQQLKTELAQLNIQFQQRAQSIPNISDFIMFKRDTNEAERLEAELKLIKAFEHDIDVLFLEEVLQLSGELNQTNPHSEFKPCNDNNMGYIIFYRDEQHMTFEWSDQHQQWCSQGQGSCYPSRIAVEQQFIALKAQWADLTLKVGRR